MAGTKEDYLTAVTTVTKFKLYGLEDVRMEPYDVLLSSPISRAVRMISPRRLDLSLEEPELAIDPSSSLPVVDTFNGYSASGPTCPLISMTSQAM
jgi:hypothetical protein